MSDDINIKVSLDDSEVYSKLSRLRDSVKKVKDQLTLDLRSPSKGGLSAADFKKTYGIAKGEHGRFLKDLEDLDKSYSARQREATVSGLVDAQYRASEKARKIKDREVKDSERAARQKASFEERANLSTQQHKQRIVEDGAKSDNRIRVNNAKSENRLNEQNNSARNKRDTDAHKQRLTDASAETRHRQQQENIILRTQAANYLIGQRARIRSAENAAKAEARAQASAQRASQMHTLDAPSVRYAFYDIAQNANIATAAIVGFGVATVKAAADYETAFTDIERTTLGTVEELGSVKNQIIAISEQVPIAFKELSNIASIGAQLGLSTSDVAGFAKTVSEFSAASNVSSESAASAFGTIGELFNIAAGDYDKLGSAIAYVGVNSTATESQIISVTEAIAGVAASAGFSAESAVGLSGALASLKIPAEQSRGALTRIFQEVSRSAAGTGADMQNFANILGMSAEEAKSLATTDMESFFMKFVSGLQGMSVTDLTGTLDALNLSDVRVANTLSRLSNNLNVVNNAMSDSSKAYSDGTFLSQVYAMRVEDLNSKIQILINDLTTMMAKIGEAVTPVIGPIIDMLSDLAKAMNDALSTDAGKQFAGTATVILGVVAAMTGLLGAAASVAAAMSLTSFTVTKLGAVFGAHRAKTVAATIATSANTAATGANAAANVSSELAIIGASGAKAANSRATTANTVATEASTVAQGANAAAFEATGVAATTAGVGMRAFKIALASTGIGLAIILLGELAAAFMQANDSADIQFQNFVTDTSGLSAALGADKKARDEALAAGNATLASSYIEVERTITSNSAATDKQLQAYKDTADFLGTDAIAALNDYSGALDDNTNYIGENTRNWLRSQLMKSEEFQKLIQDNPDFVDAFEQLGGNFNDYLNAAVQDGQAGIDQYFTGLINAMVAKGGAYAEQAYAIADQLGIAMNAVTGAASGGNTNTPIRGRASQFGTGELGGSAIKASNAVSTMNKILLGSVNQMRIFGSETSNATDTTDDFSSSLDGLGDSAGGATERIYLLTDYANDLASVWERAKDIRFSGTETLDKVTSSFRKIAEATSDAMDKIKELNADIAELNADKALQEYFLSVAEAYGDTIKAQELRASLAKIDADLTKKTKDLQKAQDKTNKTLIGNSDAAIENRAEILDLVSTYQDHIKALAASGLKEDELRAKTAQLKQDFIAQATQLGYNVDELGLYAVAFDDVRSAIDNVPRNVTVDFNGDPALTAIQEWAAKARNAISSGGGTVTPQVDTGKLERLANLMKKIQAMEVILQDKPTYVNVQKLNALNAQVQSGDYATGGYVSGPGSATSDSIPANLSNGEYVIKAAAVNKYGIGFFDRLNQMQTPHYASGGAVTPASTGMVSLSPEDRALLRNIGGSGDITLAVDGVTLARAVNQGNQTIVATGGRR